jgi:hypothetical protein
MLGLEGFATKEPLPITAPFQIRKQLDFASGLSFLSVCTGQRANQMQRQGPACTGGT